MYPQHIRPDEQEGNTVSHLGVAYFEVNAKGKRGEDARTCPLDLALLKHRAKALLQAACIEEQFRLYR